MSNAKASWIVAVGDELLSGYTSDTNSAWLAQRLSQSPYPCARIVVVPDRVEAIAAELQAAASAEADRIFCCGGLGPTPDDRTMAGVARMLGVELVVDEGVLAGIRERVARRFREGRAESPEPNPGNLKMSLIPRGATVLRNPVGGAPPLAIPLPSAGSGGGWLFVLPGVPAELRAVFEEEIEPGYMTGEGGRHYRELRFEGVPESSFFPALVELETSFPELSFGSYPQTTGGVIIRASAADSQALDEAITVLRRLAPAPPVS
ncbi:MAG: molybdopterin-binding protein [Candidatus Dormiibacterota bacterium]